MEHRKTETKVTKFVDADRKQLIEEIERIQGVKLTPIKPLVNFSSHLMAYFI